MATSRSGLSQFGNMLNGSRTNHTIVGCRQDPDDPDRFFIMEANGHEIPDSHDEPIQTIVNGGDRSTIVGVNGKKVQVLYETGCKQGI